MDWDNIQNFSSNIVFGVLLFSMTLYWVSLSFFKQTNNLLQIGRISSIYILLMLQVKIKIDILNNFRVLYF